MTSKLSKHLTRDDIFAAQDRATQEVEVPEWGGTVTVRALSGNERDRYQNGMLKYGRNDRGGIEITAVDADTMHATLVSLSIVDADGKRMFADKDVLALGDKSGAALDRVYNVALRLSGLTDLALEAAKDGLKGDRNGASGSSSPETSA